MIPQEHYDEELRRVADRLAYEYGLTTTFVTGAILIEDARGETFKARGVYTGQGVILQADCKESVTSLAAHELFHDRAAHDSGLVDAAWRELVRQYGPAEMRKLLRDYTIRLRGEISVDEYSDIAALDEAGLRIAEEICADAYAKMNAFGLGAYQYSKTVRRAMNERADAGRQQNGERETRGPPEERYSVSESFADDVQTWYDETKPAQRATSPGYFLIGTTSDALRSIGARTDNIYMRKYKIGTILEDHPEIDISDIKRVPEILENPVLVMKSQTHPDSIVVFGEVKARNGDNIMAAVQLTPTPGGNSEAEFSLVTSAYARTRENIQNLIQNSELLYLDPDKKRTNNWLMQLRVQFPSRQPPFGSIGSITYTDDGVNIQGKTLNDLGVKMTIAADLDAAEKTINKIPDDQKSPIQRAMAEAIRRKPHTGEERYSRGDEEEGSADTGLRLPPPPGSGDFTDGGETVYTERERLDRAAALVRSRAEPSEVYNATGFVKMANGSLVDPESGTVVWREENDTGRSQEYADGVEIGGQTQAGVSENDGRGVSGLSGGKDRTFLRQGWETLVHAEQRIAERIIVNHLLENQNDLTDLILAEYEGEETALSEKIYRLYAQGNIVFEREAGQFMLDPDGLADRLDEALGEAEERYSRDDEDKARISNLDSLFASAPSERRSGAFQSSC